MKFLRTLLFVSLLFPALKLSAQCSGDFTWTATGSTVSFEGIVTLNVTNIIWSFGDGNYDTNNNIYPIHTYSGPGPYTACITVFDSINFCGDSTCHTIVLDSCYASYTYIVNGLTADFYGVANNMSPSSVFVYDFGDNSPAVYSQNPSYTYATAGTYNVCLIYDDFAGCSDSICMPVTVGGCYADFTWVDSLGYVFFINNSTLGNSGIYFWDFGDGNYSSQQNPSNTYASPGMYTVCLTVLDSNQNFCDSTCYSLTIVPVSGLNEDQLNITNISLSPNPSDESAMLAFFMAQPGNAVISVVDLAGREVSNPVNNPFSAGKQQVVINTQDFAPGIYFVQINMKDQSAKSKLIVTHR